MHNIYSVKFQAQFEQCFCKEQKYMFAVPEKLRR